MASLQWYLTLIAAILCRHLVLCCHPSSIQLHICLNIYLERDFHHIEAILEGQLQVSEQYDGGQVILEEPVMQNICDDVSSLISCYSSLIEECDTLWQLDRFRRVLGVIGITHRYLCANSTGNVQDLLLNSACLVRARDQIAVCSGFDWWLSWREVLRMQVSPSDRCSALLRYRDCLQRRLPDVVCGQEASRVFLALMDVWLKHWCGMRSTPEEDRKLLYYALSPFDGGSKHYSLT